MARRNINAAGLSLVKSFESFVPFVYDDLVVGKGGKYPEWTGWKPKGTLTIGYGHTNDAKHPLKIKQGLRISEAEALDILNVDLDDCEDRVSRAVKVPLTDNQFAALVSFDFNTGAIFKASFVKDLNRGNYAAVRPGLMQWVNAKGKMLKGLVRRREAEAALFTRKDAARKVDPLPAENNVPKGNVVAEPPAQDESLSQSGVIRGTVVAAPPAAGYTADKAIEVAEQAQKGFSYIEAGTIFGFVCGVIVLGALGYVYYSRAKAADKLPSWWPKWLGGAAAVLVASLLIGAPDVGRAHEAPSGFRYLSSCCSDQDCRPADPGEIVPVSGGWHVVPSNIYVVSNDHRIHESPDGRFHICNVEAGNRKSAFWCIYIPAHGS